LFLSLAVELCWEAPGTACGLELAGTPLLGAGVKSALERGALNALAGPLASDGRFAGVTELDAGAGRLAKKPAMLCCFGPVFEDCELPVLVSLGGGRGVAISLPSIPRAMIYSYGISDNAQSV